MQAKSTHKRKKGLKFSVLVYFSFSSNFFIQILQMISFPISIECEFFYLDFFYLVLNFHQMEITQRKH